MLNNIKKNRESGFTIVELLIVIVVIAILAAISIVAYNGIQSRGKEAAAQSLASQIAKKAEAYNTIQSSYPTTKAAFNAVGAPNESKLDNTAAVVLDDPANESTVGYKTCDSGKGFQVIYKKFQTSGTGTISGGTTTSCDYPES